MKSQILVGLVLSLSVACTSTDGDQALEDGMKSDAKAVETTGGEVKAAPEAATAPAGVEAAMGAKGETAAAAPAAAEAPAAAPANTADVEHLVYPTTSLLNLRKGPGKSHAVGRVAKFGEGIALGGEQKNGWLLTSEGLWVTKSLTSETKPAAPNDPVVQAAPVAEAPKVAEPEAVAPAAAEAPQAIEATTPAAGGAAAPSAP